MQTWYRNPSFWLALASLTLAGLFFFAVIPSPYSKGYSDPYRADSALAAELKATRAYLKDTVGRELKRLALVHEVEQAKLRSTLKAQDKLISELNLELRDARREWREAAELAIPLFPEPETPFKE